MAIDEHNIQALHTSLIENTRDVITLLDLSGIVQYQSPSIIALFGYDPEELVGTLIFDRVHGEDRERALNILQKILAGEDVAPFIIRFQHKNGSWRFVEVIAHQLNEEISGVLLNSRDVTDYEETSLARRLIDASFEAAFKASSTINSITVVETGEFINVNDGWVNALGWSREEAIGKTANDLNVWGAPENRDSIIGALQQHDNLRGHRAQLTTKTGKVLTVLLDAVYLSLPVGRRLYFSAVDITEKEQTEERLRQSQRLESIGQLTGGIAHDFNNLLSVILGHADLAAKEPGIQSQVLASLNAIKRASVTGANLIQQLLSFSRKQRLNPVAFRICDHIEAMKPLLQTTIAKDIKLEIEYFGEGWYCMLDPLQFDNAILNITLNARDAMPNGGQLRFRIEELTLGKLEASRYDFQPGDFIKLSIEDTGTGMTDDSKRLAFEPFFTTKQDAGGSGLGLSMVFGFIHQSGGHVFIAPGNTELATSAAPNTTSGTISEANSGTTISMLLPRVPVPTQQEIAADIPEVPSLHNKDALLVEDNPDVRMLVSKFLASLGFKVTEVASATQAETLERTKFDLLVCDVMLPGNRKGPEIARLFRERQPELAVLYMSGYQQGVVTTEDLQQQHVSFIHKPFSRDDFSAQIRRLLPD